LPGDPDTGSAVEITLIRHGQSVSNVTGHWQGHGDSPLSDHGVEQAQALAERLSDATFDRIIASDLSRATDTARAVGGRIGKEPELRKSWREIDVGDWEGLTRAEVKERFPEQIAALKAGEPIKIGGAESWLELAQRSHRAFEALRAELEPGQRAVVFAHGGVIASLVGLLFGVSRDKRRLGNVANTAITTIRHDGKRPTLLRYNDATHVGPLPAWGQERLERGATVVGLVPESYRYDVPLKDPVDGDLGTHLSTLAEAHPGERLGVIVDPKRWNEFTRSVLGEQVALGAPLGPTHVVISEHGQALADLNVGH
jgi:broad specificity phosphatase PhoE